MSQVIRKFQDGGEFVWEDVGNFNANDFTSAIVRNVDNFIRDNNLNEKQSNEFREGVKYFVEGINKGTIVRNNSGQYIDKEGNAKSTGKFKLFDKSNNTYNRVASLANNVLNGLTPKTNMPTELPTFGIDLEDSIKSKHFGGNNFNSGVWAMHDEDGSTANRGNLIADILDSSFTDLDENSFNTKYKLSPSFKSYQSLVDAKNKLTQSLRDGKLDKNDIILANELGINNLDRFLKTKGKEEIEEPEKTLTTKDEFTDWSEKTLPKDSTSFMITPNVSLINAKNLGMNLHDNSVLYNPEVISSAILPPMVQASLREISQEEINERLSTSEGRKALLENVNPFSYFKSLEGTDKVDPEEFAKMFSVYQTVGNDALDKYKEKDDFGNEYIYIPETINDKDYYVYRVNTTTNKVERVPINVSNMFTKDLYQDFMDKTKKIIPTYKKKDGGVVKYQLGGRNFTIEDEVRKSLQEDTANKPDTSKQVKTTTTQLQEKQSPRNEKLSSGLSASDILRFGALGTDLISLVSGFVPGAGTAISLGTGVVGSGANFAADIAEDGFQMSDLGNFATNLGLNAVEILPGLGNLSKARRIMKAVKVAIPTLTALGVVHNAPELTKTIETMATKDLKDWTKQDLYNLGELANVLVSLVGAGRRGVKSNKDLKKTGNVILQGKNKTTHSVSTEQAEALSNTKGFKNKRKLAKEITNDPNFEYGTRFLKDFDMYPFKKIGTSQHYEYQLNTGPKMKGDFIVGSDNKPNFQRAYGADIAPKQKPTKSPVKEDIEILKANPKLDPKEVNLYNAIEARFQKMDLKGVSQSDIDKALVNNARRLSPTLTEGKSDLEILKNFKKIRNQVKNNYPKITTKSQPKKKTIKNNTSLIGNIRPGGFSSDITYEKEGGKLIPKHQLGSTIGSLGNINRKQGSFYGSDIDAKNPSTWNNVDYSGVNGGLQGQSFLDWLIEGENIIANSPKTVGYNQTGWSNFNNWFNKNQYLNNTYFGNNADKYDLGGLSTNSRREWLNYIQKNATTPETAINGVYFNNGKPVISNIPPSIKGNNKALDLSAITPDVNAIKTKSVSPSNSGKNSSTFVAGTQNGNNTFRPENFLEMGRMVGGLVTNAQAAKTYKEALKPVIANTYENIVPIQGNQFAKLSAQLQSAMLNTQASRPRTSDASLQLAMELEANNKGRQLQLQGDLADADQFYKTRALAQQESDATKARRVQVDNENRARINQVEAAKKQIDAAKLTADYQQVIAPYVAGVENRYRQKTAIDQNNANLQNQSAIQAKYSDQQQALMSQYQNAFSQFTKANPGLTEQDFQKSDVGKNILAQINQIRNNMSSEIFASKNQNNLDGWLYESIQPFYNVTPQYRKRGGKLSAKDIHGIEQAKDFNKRLRDDAKQFHTDMMRSKQIHADLIKSLSPLTAALILKGMSL